MTTLNMGSYFSSNLRLRDPFLRSSYRKCKTYAILQLDKRCGKKLDK